MARDSRPRDSSTNDHSNDGRTSGTRVDKNSAPKKNRSFPHRSSSTYSGALHSETQLLASQRNAECRPFETYSKVASEMAFVWTKSLTGTP